MSLATLIVDQDFAAALSRALELWRKKPHAVLAEIVREIAVHAKDAAVESAFERITDASNTVAMKKALDSFMAEQPADPRIFDLLVGMFAHPAYDIATGNPRKLYDAIVNCLHGLHDERVEPWVEKLPEFLQARKGSRHGQLSREEIDAATAMFGARAWATKPISALTSAELAEVNEARARLDSLGKGRLELAARRDELFANVIAHWEDDEHKEVFADWLLENGDLLGEFVLLELARDREGKLDDERAARRAELNPIARKFQPMGAEYRKGFAVSARFKGHDGNHYGSYGTELGWGTIRSCDVAPTSDACHTENLTELDLTSSFVADLAKLKKPLERLTHLTWRAPTPTARPKWKKISVLPKLERLTLSNIRSGVLDFILGEGPGKNVTELVVEGREMVGAPELLSIIAAIGREGTRLRRAELAPHFTFEREAGEIALRIRVTDARVRKEIEGVIAGLPRPLVDRVEIHGPGEATGYRELLALGRHPGRVTFAPSVFAEQAERTRNEGELTITTDPGSEATFDADALAWVLSEETRRREGISEVVIENGVQLEQLDAYMNALTIGLKDGLQLTIRMSSSRWQHDKIVVRMTIKGQLTVEVAHRQQIESVLVAARSVQQRVKEIVVRHSPWLDDAEREALLGPLRALCDNVRVEADEAVFARMFFVEVRVTSKRVVIRPKRYGFQLRPSTLDVLLRAAIDFVPRSIHIDDEDAELEPWLSWMEGSKAPPKISWSAIGQQHDSLALEKAGLTLELSFWVPAVVMKRLGALADARLATIRLKTRGEGADVPKELMAECKRVAGRVEIVPPK